MKFYLDNVKGLFLCAIWTTLVLAFLILLLSTGIINPVNPEGNGFVIFFLFMIVTGTVFAGITKHFKIGKIERRENGNI